MPGSLPEGVFYQKGPRTKRTKRTKILSLQPGSSAAFAVPLVLCLAFPKVLRNNNFRLFRKIFPTRGNNSLGHEAAQFSPHERRRR